MYNKSFKTSKFNSGSSNPQLCAVERASLPSQSLDRQPVELLGRVEDPGLHLRVPVHKKDLEARGARAHFRSGVLPDGRPLHRLLGADHRQSDDARQEVDRGVFA